MFILVKFAIVFLVSNLDVAFIIESESPGVTVSSSIRVYDGDILERKLTKNLDFLSEIYRKAMY